MREAASAADGEKQRLTNEARAAQDAADAQHSKTKEENLRELREFRAAQEAKDQEFRKNIDALNAEHDGKSGQQ